MPENKQDSIIDRAAEREKRAPRKIAAQKERKAALILIAVFMAGTALTLLFANEWAFLLLPLLAGVGVALTWKLICWLWLARDAERLLLPSFAKPIRHSLAVPLWCAFAYLMLLLPGRMENVNDDFVTGLVMLLLLFVIVAVPISLIITSILGIRGGAQHLRNTPESETQLYRGLPLILPIALCIVSFSILIFGSLSFMFTI